MLGHDNPQIQDMAIKGSIEGKTYIGPGPDPGGMDDREVVSFDGRYIAASDPDSVLARPDRDSTDADVGPPARRTPPMATTS